MTAPDIDTLPAPATVLTAGSIATDHLMTFAGKFSDAILPEKLARLSVSFLTDDLQVRHGGVGANIAFGMASLGATPHLVGAVGADFDTEYRPHLEARGVDCSGVAISASKHTARFVCTTDTEACQIASFYAGAMTEAGEIDITPLLTGVDMVVVSPDDTSAMLRHTRAAHAAGVPVFADPSQQLTFLDDRAMIRELVDGAAYLFTNDYEKQLLETKTGWSDEEVLSRVGTRVTTLGADGVVATRVGHDDIAVAAVELKEVVDPTGGGDALRAGFLAARGRGLGIEASLQVGVVLATTVLGAVGTQTYDIDPGAFTGLLGITYGPAAAAAVRAAFGW